MKTIYFTLAVALLTTSLPMVTQAHGLETANSCKSMRWIVSIGSPASGYEVAKFFEVLSADPLFQTLRLSSFESRTIDDSFQIKLEVTFRPLDTMRLEEAKQSALKSIDEVIGMSHTRVHCDRLSGGTGRLSGSN